MLTVIIANGDWADPPNLQDILARSSFTLAVDGGADHCRRLGIIPDALIGDLDSIDPAVLQEFTAMAVAIHRYPPQKDAVDLELALDLALDKGMQEVWLLAALGGRWDMSLANMLLLAKEKYQTLHFIVAGSGCIMHILRPGDPFTLTGSLGQKVSFLPLHGNVHGLTLHGFLYPLRNADLVFGSTRGVSNVLQQSGATVQFESGLLLCIRLYGP